jgi:ethanolamine utilization protein EutQ (cupin superfamily)
MIQITQFDPANLQRFSSYQGHYVSWEDMKIDDPACVASFSVKRRTDDISAPWHLWNDEVWYIIEGEMELEWSNPPMFNDTQRAVVQPGQLLFLKLGTMFKMTIRSEEVRLLWVAMPRPRYFSSDDFWEGKP